VSAGLKVLLVGGPMYDPLYERLPEFEEEHGVKVEAVVAPTHPDLNEGIEEEFGSSAVRCTSPSTSASQSSRRSTG